MKKLLIALLIIVTINTVAQVGFNSDGSTPDNSAMLDINSTEKGILIPRMTEAERNAIVSPAQGLMVFQTDNTAGFYFYKGSAWTRITALSTDPGWKLNGNSGTTSGTHFIGTTDNQALDIKTNNTLKIRITAKGQIEIFHTGKSVFVGEGAGANDNLSDNKNVFTGYYSGYSNISGRENISVGYEALKDNTDGNYNTAVGYQSLKENVHGSNNVAIGYQALVNCKASNNTGVGEGALYSNENGTNNVAIGRWSLHNNVSGNNNVALGAYAGYNATGSGNVFIGCNAGFHEQGDNKLYIDNTATSHPLIYGDFSEDYITINGKLQGQEQEFINADMKAYIYGNVNVSGNLIANASSEGFVVVKATTGTYEIRFDHAMPGADAYVVLATIGWGSGIGFIKVVNVSNMAARIYTYSPTGNLSDKPFHFIIFKK